MRVSTTVVGVFIVDDTVSLSSSFYGVKFKI